MSKIEDLTQENIDKMEKALEDYKKENQKFREERDEARTALANKEPDETATKFRDRALKSEAKLAFAGLGIKDSDRLVKYLDLSKISIDDQDKVVGLSEEVERIKTDFPEVFDVKRRVGGKLDAGAKSEAGPQKSFTQLQVERALSK